MSAPFRGLTWDHPRGFDALNRAGRQSGLVTWSKQPLEGFESAPIAEICRHFDLVVLDHPHLGEAIASACLRPLDELFDSADLARIEAGTVGPCFRSYSMLGSQWALPLDAATQVMALRSDLVEYAPADWEEVFAYAARTGKVALCVAGPHALLSLVSIAASLDADLDLACGGWLKRQVAIEACEIFADLFARTPPSVRDLNPITFLDRMTRCDEIALCPLVYGYVNYTSAAMAVSLTFRDAPHARRGGRPGSTLGGTGIAISARADVTPALVSHLLWLMSSEAQREFIPRNHGQPSSREAWADRALSAPTHGFYGNTRRTIEQAAIRPRHAGFIKFQTAASALLREACGEGRSARAIAETLDSMFRQSLPRHEGEPS
ncbi:MULTISPECIES: carbohydrate ABC transporter substrate-binding protein [unclassified Roseitalea]|uniref:carbohydrate ABC transporter substrate-binding protein n=1 Tax=unclassified Roseitalea TaxID=2639107 RepID=UPI00273E06CD|nr:MULTISPECIES: carbohydrate ABC transporter substrate-binding protein [unclassified Roseitalea]